MQGRSRRQRSLALIASLALPALTACYGYREAASVEELSPETRVRVELVEAGEGGGREGNGRARSRLDGHLVEVGSDSVYLATERSTAGARYRVGPVPLDTLGIARAQLGRVSRRELSVWRTATLLAGGTAAVAGYVVVGFDAAGGSRPRDDTGGGVESTLLPILTVPVP